MVVVSGLSVLPTAGQPQPALASQNDLQAIATWLEVKASRSPRTRENYQREAHRLLVFLQQEMHLNALAEVRVEHLQLYWRLLADPPPHWLMQSSRGEERRQEPTRLLRHALSARSIDYTRTVVHGLFEYLHRTQYLAFNPVAATGRGVVDLQLQAEKGLEPAAWTFFWHWLVQREQNAVSHAQHQRALRDRWLCALLYHSGLRRASVVGARMADIQRRQGHWSLQVTVKGGKQHRVPLGRVLLAELVYYRQQLELPDLPSPEEPWPLIGSLRDPARPLTPRSIGLLFEGLSAQCAAACPDLFLAAQIRQLTCHGVRHTFATHSLLAGARLESVQKALGHAAITTTSIYARVTEDMQRELAEQVDDYWLRQHSRSGNPEA